MYLVVSHLCLEIIELRLSLIKIVLIGFDDLILRGVVEAVDNPLFEVLRGV